MVRQYRRHGEHRRKVKVVRIRWSDRQSADGLLLREGRVLNRQNEQDRTHNRYAARILLKYDLYILEIFRSKHL